MCNFFSPLSRKMISFLLLLLRRTRPPRNVGNAGRDWPAWRGTSSEKWAHTSSSEAWGYTWNDFTHQSKRARARRGWKTTGEDRKGKSSEVHDQTTNDKNNTYNELDLGLLVRIGCFTNWRLASEWARLHWAKVSNSKCVSLKPGSGSMTSRQKPLLSVEIETRRGMSMYLTRN